MTEFVIFAVTKTVHFFASFVQNDGILGAFDSTSSMQGGLDDLQFKLIRETTKDRWTIADWRHDFLVNCRNEAFGNQATCSG